MRQYLGDKAAMSTISVSSSEKKACPVCIEFAVMQSPSKLYVASVSAPIALPELQGWADVPDGLLHSIVALSGSFRDLLAFAATCRSWRAAFSSYPSKSTFCTRFPPLLVQPNVRIQAPHLPSNNGHRMLWTCKVIDPVNQNSALCCQIPQETYQKMHFVGSSYGQLIFYHDECFLVVDVFTGAEVSPPPLPSSNHCEEFYYRGTLTAPLASPNSHLLVNIESYLFDWQVGSDSWSVLQLSNTGVQQIVELNGQFIVMDYNYKIYTLQLAPQLGLQKITTEWCSGLAPGSFYSVPWLAVCGDMLLMVTCYVVLSGGCTSAIYHRLETSTNPAKWVKVMKLDNWALFVGGDLRSPQFSCMTPERWGGRSKCLYYAALHSEPWTVCGMGGERNPTGTPDIWFKRRQYRKLQPLWVYPSMFYSDGQ